MSSGARPRMSVVAGGRMSLTPDGNLTRLTNLMESLEAMLADIESVSEILDFGSNAPGGTLIMARDGATRLAHDVSNCLAKFRAAEEEKFLAVSRRNAKALKDAVESRRRVEKSRARVRQVVRRDLFNSARTALKHEIDMLHMQPPDPLPKGFVEYESLGVVPVVIGAIKKRLNVAIAPVEAMRINPPEEMARAQEVIRKVMDRKRLRIQVQSSGLPAMAAALDADLLHVAEQSFKTREEALETRFHRQLAVLRGMKEAIEQRGQAFATLNEWQKKGPAMISEDTWKALAPQNDSLDRTLQVAPRAFSAEHMETQLRTRGERQVATLLAEFNAQSAAPVSDAFHQRTAKHDIHLWRLDVTGQLLHELTDVINTEHERIVERVSEAMVCEGSDGHKETETETTRVAEDFNAVKMKGFADLSNFALGRLTDLTREDITRYGQWRRRLELCSSKRYKDNSNGFSELQANAQAHDNRELAEVVSGIIARAHNALPLPRNEFMAVQNTAQPPPGMKSLHTVEERIHYAINSIGSMPDSVETCAIGKAVLCAMEDELQRIATRLYPMSRRAARVDAFGVHVQPRPAGSTQRDPLEFKDSELLSDNFQKASSPRGKSVGLRR